MGRIWTRPRTDVAAELLGGNRLPRAGIAVRRDGRVERGLRHLCTTDGGVIKDLVGRFQPQSVTASASLYKEAVGLDCNSSGQYIDFDAGFLQNASALTMLFRVVRRTDTSPDENTIIGNWSGGTNRQFIIRWDDATTTLECFWETTSQQTTHFSDIVMDLYTPTTIAVRYNAGTVNAFQNGFKLSASGSIGANLKNAVPTENLTIGTSPHASADYFAGNIDLCAIWDVVVPDSDLREWTRDFSLLLEPANDRIFVYSDVAGPITGTGALTAQDATISGTGEITKTGTGALTAGDASISGTGTVSGVGTVTGSGALAAVASVIAGTGVRETTGSGALTAQAAQISGGVAPPVPYDISWKGGGRVMRPGQFPEWWKEEEEPQPQEIESEKPKSKDKLAELAGELSMPKPEKKPKKKKPKAKVVPISKPPAKAPESPKPEPKPVEAELRTELEALSKSVKRMEKKLAAALILLLRMRK